MAKLIKQIYDLVALGTDKGLTSYWPDDQIMNVIDSVQMALYRPLIENFAKTKQIRNELLPFMKRANITMTAKIGPLPADFEHEIDFWASVGGVNETVRLFEGGTFRRRLTDPVDVPSTTNLIGNIYNDGTTKQIEISNQVTPLVINYFKRPAKPVYATTLTYTFTVTSANATAGATYTNNGQTFVVVTTIAGGVTLVCTSVGAPAASGTLTKASGTGDATITFSAVTASTQYVYSDSLSTDVEWSPLVWDILSERSLALLGLSIRDNQVQRVGQNPVPKEASISQ